MLNGGPIKLSSLRGKVVILDFFRSTCPHCQQHAPHMAQMYNQFRDRGLTILGLSSDAPEDSQSVRAFIRQYKIPYAIGFMTTETLAYYADSHDHGVPQIVLFGANGKMVRRWIGWDEKTARKCSTWCRNKCRKCQPSNQPPNRPSNQQPSLALSLARPLAAAQFSNWRC